MDPGKPSCNEAPHILEIKMLASKPPQDSPHHPYPAPRRTANRTAGSVRLLQLSDPHLFAQPAGQLLGITTRFSFEAVLEWALAGPDKPDALVLTGDLVHDDSPDGYRYLRRILDQTGLPYDCLAGNHDRRDLMDACLGSTSVEPVVSRRLGAWHLIFLDSANPGHNSGYLSPEQLHQLGERLAADPAPTLIFLHHHPVPVGSAWMDTMGVVNGADLLGLVAIHPQIKGMVFGHVHQAFASMRAGCRFLGAPSTCVQFLPGSKDFALDERPPGYRELLLEPDGRLETRVIRLDQYPESPLQRSGGY
ncbi:Icc protein [Thiobaca trueperi]|uniref:Icc protein n=2 Tax=Thiobaca trueperi TaxID=127458 RepID=A0A4V2V0T0_9GAMM|nr:Icc protein [Thiobaca trueperi]